MKDERETTLAGLRSAAFIAIVIGAIGSIGLLRHAQQHPPPLIVALFVVWVAAPFAALAVANVFSSPWSRNVRLTLYVTTLLVTVASLGIYYDDNIAHRTAKPAFVWVAVPPASVLLSAVALGFAMLIARRSAAIKS
jgi:ACR3 family arsenite efflux pump ArsB